MSDERSLGLRNHDVTETGRLLVVEDDPDNLALVLAILSKKHKVLGFGSAAEALTVLEIFEPNLVVLDVGMSPVNGLQCLNEIRATPKYCAIPAIALTGFARDVDRETFLAAGFRAVVTKPILNQREFEALVEGLLKSAAASEDRNPALSERENASTDHFVNRMS